MRGVRQLSRHLSRVLTDNVATQAQSPACQSILAVRAYSSAMLNNTQSYAVRDPLTSSNSGHAHASVWPCQPTLLVSPHFRNFSSDTSEGLHDHAQAATEMAGFDPTAILNAVAGTEEDSWVAAREDVWFFNRYMQTVLRAAQEFTGLPW